MKTAFKPLFACVFAGAFTAQTFSQPYHQNQAPLLQKPYMEIPLGKIKPMGWLEEMLKRQKYGATGTLDELYPTVMGERNGWLGGDGDQWERGPYWIDGLLPLAYLLEDEALIEKAEQWVEWALQSQREDGYFGPADDYEPEPGLQRDNAHDWWPKMVMLKILQQYYSATEDQRVIDLFSRYFHYQLKTIQDKPLGHWTFWAEYRSADNMQAVYWLYNINHDPALLELAEILHGQGFDFTDRFMDRNLLATHRSIHCVNLAQGLKEPVIYYQQSHDPKHLEAVQLGLSDISRFNGLAHGLYGGDEALHGSNPTQGSELCTAVEMMFSLEKMLEITGNVSFAETLEKVAFNALPAQISDDFMERQYFQQANQIQITRQMYNFDVNHDGTDAVFGLLTGYPCCTSNMHQGWPKFTQNLYYASADGGVASLIYAPSRAEVLVGEQQFPVEIDQETFYPFEEQIRLTIRHGENNGISFPYHIRIPSWALSPEILVNGKPMDMDFQPGEIIKIKRNWEDGDIITLNFPMELNFNVHHEGSRSILYGPLVYALDIPGEEKVIPLQGEDRNLYGDSYTEVRPLADWNYGLVLFEQEQMDELFTVNHNEHIDKEFPWNRQNAPITIRVKGRQLPFWQMYNGMAGPMPSADMHGVNIHDLKEEEISLIPYGCTTLRISQFPMIRP